MDVMEFTDEDIKAIASIDLPSIKPHLTNPQFEALCKFVSVNQAVEFLNQQNHGG